MSTHRDHIPSIPMAPSQRRSDAIGARRNGPLGDAGAMPYRSLGCRRLASVSVLRAGPLPRERSVRA